MDDARIHTFTDRIQRSVLLSPDRAAALLTTLPSLSDDQASELSSILESENGFVEALSQRVVTDAVIAGNGDVLARIDALCARGKTALRQGEETSERSNEQQKADHLFDDA